MKIKIIVSYCFIILGVTAKSQINSLSLADSLYFKGDFQHAIPIYKNVLSDTSTSALLWQRLAYSNLNANNYDDALSAYKKSLSLKPNPVLKNIIYTNVLIIYNKQHKPNDALELLKQGADSGFSNFALIDTASVFQELKNNNDYILVFNKIRSNAYPCLSQPHGNDFDFWIGEWDVYVTGTSNLVGKSVITKTNGGCVILENWTSLVSPVTGISLNFIDPETKQWTQDYSGSDGSRQLFVDGNYTDSAMRFTYESKFNDTLYPGHFIFYKQGEDQVRQYQDYTTDGNKTTITLYDLTYKRRK